MPHPNSIFVFFGLIATGKSTLAKAWADRKGLACLNSDVVRKKLAGIDPTSPQRTGVNLGIYSPTFTRRTYDALLEFARSELAGDRSVVLDASYQSRSERANVLDLAKHLQAQVYFILCVCPEEELRQRMAQRARDPSAVSDGRWEIYQQQRIRFEAPDELEPTQLITIDTAVPLQAALENLDSRLTD